MEPDATNVRNIHFYSTAAIGSRPSLRFIFHSNQLARLGILPNTVIVQPSPKWLSLPNFHPIQNALVNLPKNSIKMPLKKLQQKYPIS